MTVGCSPSCVASFSTVFSADRVVEPPLGDLAAQADLQRRRQEPQVLDLRQQRVRAFPAHFTDDLPVEVRHAGGLVGVPQRAAAVIAHLREGQIFQRARLPLLAVLARLLVVIEVVLLHQALHVQLERRARLDLVDRGQELILQRRLRRGGRLHLEAHGRLPLLRRHGEEGHHEQLHVVTC
jgi:hypothetical protein